MAVIFDQIKGHDEILNRLRSATTQNRLPHALLFVGPSGVGKKQVALGLAQLLVCTKQVGCGNCGPCLRIEKKQSESLLFIEPSGVQIKLAESRKITQFLSLQSYSSARIVIVDSADMMNIQAANSLLKIVEEPPEGTVFIFISPTLSGLIPTIRSRCQVIRFTTLDRKTLMEISGARGWVLDSCQGRLDILEQLLEKELNEIRSRGIKAWSHLSQGQWMRGLEDLREDIKDRKSSLFLVRVWQQFLRDMTFKKLSLTPLIHKDFSDMSLHFEDTEMSTLLNWEKKSYQLEADILANMDRSLCFEKFGMDLANSN